VNTKFETSCTTANDITRQVKKHVFGKDVSRMSDQSPFCRKSTPLVKSRAFAVACVLSDAFQNKVSSTPSVSP